MTLIEKAKDFSHRAHDSIGQKRKYTGEPYWVHTDAVAAHVAELGGDENTVAAAHLHDYLEDVIPELNKRGEIEKLLAFEKEYDETFPQPVKDMVIELTDVYIKETYPQYNRKQRKALEMERLGKTSPESMTIKLCDLINNTASIVAHDRDFAVVYLGEKLSVLPYLADGSPRALQQASLQVIAGHMTLGISLPTLAAPNLS